MTLLTFHSPAKVNLTLDVLGRDDATGYHLVQTILHEAPDFYDELTFERRPTFEVTLDAGPFALPPNNTITRAARLLQSHTKTSHGAHITLVKKIPLGSGFGGPASNAATTLKALNQLWELNLPDPTLRQLATKIGMDVPFFITGGCAIAMHYGEQLEHLPTLDRFGFALDIIPTDISVSTPNAYATLDLTTAGQRNRDTGRLVALLKKYGPPTQDDLAEIPLLLHNDFAPQFFALHPDLHKKYSNAHLSGTGGSLFRLTKTHAFPQATVST